MIIYYMKDFTIIKKITTLDRTGHKLNKKELKIAGPDFNVVIKVFDNIWKKQK